MWPELAALLGLVAIVAVLYGLHRRASMGSAPTTLAKGRILQLIALWLLTPIAIGPGLWLLFDKFGLYHLVLTQAICFQVAFALIALYFVKRTTQKWQWSALLVALYLGVLGVCGAHTLRLHWVDWPSIELDGIAYQHLGLDQEITATLSDRDVDEWTLDRSKALVSGDAPGVQHVSFTAWSGTELLRKTLHVDVGRELTSGFFPLAERNSWTYRRTSREEHLEDLETTHVLYDRSEDGPLYTLGITNTQGRLFAHNGKVYVRRGRTKAELLIGSEAPYEFNLFDEVHSRCKIKSAPTGPDIEIPGPTQCDGRLITAAHRAVLAFSLGLAALDRNFGDAVHYELIRSRTVASPAFRIPDR